MGVLTVVAAIGLSEGQALESTIEKEVGAAFADDVTRTCENYAKIITVM